MMNIQIQWNIVEPGREALFPALRGGLSPGVRTAVDLEFPLEKWEQKPNILPYLY